MGIDGVVVEKRKRKRLFVQIKRQNERDAIEVALKWACTRKEVMGQEDHAKWLADDSSIQDCWHATILGILTLTELTKATTAAFHLDERNGDTFCSDSMKDWFSYSHQHGTIHSRQAGRNSE